MTGRLSHTERRATRRQPTDATLSPSLSLPPSLACNSATLRQVYTTCEQKGRIAYKRECRDAGGGGWRSHTISPRKKFRVFGLEKNAFFSFFFLFLGVKQQKAFSLTSLSRDGNPPFPSPTDTASLLIFSSRHRRQGVAADHRQRALEEPDPPRAVYLPAVRAHQR